MVGIVSWGCHIPRYRISCDLIAERWGLTKAGGEVAVANFDENSVTMAAAAVSDCISSIGYERIDALYYASTTAPYKEKESSTTVAGAADLLDEVFTVDIGNSLRGATVALRLAMNGIQSETFKNSVIVASDTRLGFPRSVYEQTFGDGAASLLIGKGDDVIASIQGWYCLSDEFLDNWRRDSDKFVNSWEERFILDEGYKRNLSRVITGIMGKYDLTPKNFSKVVAYAPRRGAQAPLLEKLGFDSKTQLNDLVSNSIGNCGVATTLMMLASALEEAKPGDKILVVNYGGGADAFILQVEEPIGKVEIRNKFRANLNRRTSLESYERFLTFKRILPTEESRRPPPIASLPSSWRDREEILKFYGHKCKHCGTTQYPMERVCYNCGTKDEFDKVKLSGKRGMIVTYTIDYLNRSIDPPTIMAVAELEGGCRVYAPVTDCKIDEVQVGLEVEPTFRVLHEAGGFVNYSWKLRPALTKKGD